MGGDRVVEAVQVNYVDYHSNIFASDSSVYTQFRLHHSRDGKRWEMIADLTGEKRDRPNAYIDLSRSVRTRYIRYEHVRVASPHLGIGDIRVFGNGTDAPPKTPVGLSARRASDARNALITWRPVKGVVGYNVRWGIKPEKLYQTYQVFADRAGPLEIRALTVGQDYWFAIEAFDENGVSKPTRPMRLVSGSGSPAAGQPPAPGR